MAAKILVNYPGSLTTEAVESKKQAVANALGVCCEDVILLPNLSVSVVDLPDELTKAREKKDKEAAAAQEKAAKEAEAAAAPAAVDYDSWTAEQLHAEASKRDLPGRSGMDKAALAKELKKADKKG